MKYLIAFILTTSSSWATPNKLDLLEWLQKSPPEWFTCKANEDCKFLVDVCNEPFAVNIQSEKIVQEALSKRKTTFADCICFVGPKWPSSVSCVNNRCQQEFK